VTRPDYYRTLGVKRSATPQEVKAAFRALAKKYHPDRHPGKPEFGRKFQEITEANEVLSDPEKRSKYDQLTQYDRFGLDLSNIGGFDLGKIFKGKEGANPLSSLAGLGGLGGLYDRFFGSQAPEDSSDEKTSPPKVKGEDLHFTLTFDLATVATGTKSVLKIPRESSCGPCKGSGVSEGGRKLSCSKCRGKGQVTISQGAFGVNRPCDDCLGRGFTLKKPCASCKGLGSLVSEDKIAVKIPIGIEDGKELRLKGLGKPGTAGPGDVRVKIRIQADSVFKRRGKDLYQRIQIHAFEAMLGCHRQIPVLGGEPMMIEIPSGSQPGDKIRIPGKGVSAGGDLVVVLQLEVPRSLTPSQRSRIVSLAREMGFSIKDDKSGTA